MIFSKYNCIKYTLPRNFIMPLSLISSRGEMIYPFLKHTILNPLAPGRAPPESPIAYPCPLPLTPKPSK